jgi:opacity protein-like surface antigen
MMKLLLTSVLAWAVAGPAFACDLCQISTPSLAGGIPGQGLFGTVSEQFTHFGTLQDEGNEVANPFHQKLDSSITQILAGYQVSDRFGIQFNLPVIYRSFRRVEDMQAVHDTESGIGDASLLGRYLLWQKETEALTVNWNLYGGIKFPTGDSDRLQEEAEEGQGPVMEEELSVELAGDLPVSLDNGGLQAVPDYRIRGSLGFRF